MPSLKDKLAEARKTYEIYWDSYSKGDLETFASTLDDTFEMIGTSETEVCHTKADGIAFMKAQIEEVVGKAEMRNRQIDVVPLDQMILVNEQCDIYVLLDPDWNFYSKIRISTLLRETESGWKVIQQHGSLPDMRVQEGETLAIDKISKENLELRDAIKRRTAELENKNRELEIEAALERVRARSSAMQYADELGEVIALIFNILDEFDISVKDGVALITFNEGSKDLNEWMANPGFGSAMNFHLPYFDHPVLSNLWDAKNRGDDMLIERYSAEESRSFLNHIFEHSDFKHTPQPVKEYCLAAGTYATSIALQKHIAIFINDYSGISLTPSEVDLLKRFSTVFEQTYTRFLDLQKAEAQAREAQIEAALERVRARSMAMHQTEELNDVLCVLLEQFDFLGINPVLTHLTLFDEANEKFSLRLTTSPTSRILVEQIIDIYAVESWKASYENWKKGIPNTVDCIDYPPEALPAVWEVLSEVMNALPEGHKINPKDFPNGLFTTQGHFKFGYLGFNHRRKATEEEKTLVSRFATEFGRAYQRFLDIQKAEAQAREAQIEAALERVRSRSMGMQNTTEMQQVANETREQLLSLGLKIDALAMSGVIDNEADYDVWVGGAISQKPLRIPYNNNTRVQRDYNKVIKERPELFTKTYSGKIMKDYFRNLMANNTFNPEIEKFMLECKAFTTTLTFMKNSGMQMVRYTNEPFSEADNSILIRFGKVFEQAYIRFLDLQKAEAQAREAQIEAALEKVRSRTMAMQSSSELGNVAAELFAQMNQLVTNLWTCGFVLCEKNRNEDEWWLSMEGDFTRGFFLPNIDDYAHASLYEGWLKGEAFRAVQLDGEALQQHYDWLMGIPVSRAIFEEMDAAGLARPDWQKLHAAYFSKGYLVLITREPCGEEEIFKRFAQVFDLIYTRFLDLKKAEAQAREAQIETALEKVRSRSLGMQKSEELKEVIQVVYEQFVHLQIHVEHAGFIMDYKSRDDMHIWLADQHEVPFQVTIPYFDCAHWNSFIEAKEKGSDFFANLLGFTEKNKFYQDLFKLFPVPEEAKEYYLTCPGLAISTVLLENVGLYIENFSGIPYTDDENKILMRFGKVFQQTYTRFRDLQKAEAQTREAQIELSLEKIRAQVTSMQESSDLFDIVVSMRNEFLSLGHEADYFWHMRWSPDNYEMSMTSTDGNRLGMVITVPKFVHEQIKSLHQWEKSDNPYFVLDLDAKGAWDYLEKMNTYGHYEQMDPHAPTEEDIHHLGGLTFIMARTTHGEIGFSLPGMVPDPPEEALDTLVRFAGVFDLAYKRFEDLKVAERQHRETQIELALERVRARTMAMQHSDELADASQVLDRQVRTLGIDTWGCAFHIYADNAEGDYEWFSSANGKLPFYKTPRENIFQRFYEIGQSGETFHVEVFRGEDCKVHYDYLKTIPVVGDSLKEMEESGISLPDFQIDHLAYFKYGYILFITYKPVPEAHEVFQRFARVFEQTYTRFLDLQKLEAQTLRAEKDLIAIKAARQKAEETLTELKATQSQLIQQEKLASLGQLTAGIAHEIKNPLNFVNNFSEVSIELIQEALEEIVKTQHAASPIDQNNGLDEIIAILDDVQSNLTKIHEHGTRANNIVSSMLQHSRGGSGKKEPTDLNALIKEYVNLSYHGMRAGKNPIDVEINMELDDAIGDVPLIVEDFSRVILNICNNAFDAMRTVDTQNFAYLPVVKSKSESINYTPKLTIRTKKTGDTITIEIEDNGPGIPDKIKDKILQPFFTTKKGTEGTGLGLSITHDIVKAHGGEIKVESEEGKGTEFKIKIPV